MTIYWERIVRKVVNRKVGKMQVKAKVVFVFKCTPKTTSHATKITVIGKAANGRWVFKLGKTTYVRYMRYEVSGHEPRHVRSRKAEAGRSVVHRSLDGAGNMVQRLRYSGDVPWGTGEGKMALKRYRGVVKPFPLTYRQFAMQ